MLLRTITVFLCAFFLASCEPTVKQLPTWFVAGTTGQQGAVDILKSPNDDRQYQYLTLDNGLDVLLISDPAADKAAASLSVNVGSFENPRDRDGLAHFLEHMLFLGTDKYPDSGEYQSFISEHGGMHNAYTSLEETNYFFDVDANYLIDTLDRFARFFIAPNFDAAYVDRERHAVDSEYRLKIKDDSRREWDVLRELANPAHPFAGFSVGNLETLADRDSGSVRKDLLAFYQHYYSANQMKLVVLGAEKLAILEQAVKTRFADVPNYNLSLEPKNIPLFAQNLPFKVYIQPEKELRQLSVNFPMPSVAQDWQKKPLEFLGHLIGHEGEGSLLAALKAQGLADGLSSGLAYDSRVGAMFSVTIMLTPDGVEKHEAITEAVFEWIKRVKSDGLKEWRYQEVARMSQLNFRFSEKTAPMRYVSSLSTRLHTFTPNEVLRGAYLYDGFDEKRLVALTDYLSKNNAAIILMAPDVKTDKATVMYQAPYRVEKIVEPKGKDNRNVVSGDLSLALANAYIPETVVIHTPPDNQQHPVLLAGMEDSDLWYYGDSQFNTPKAFFEARIPVADIDDRKRETLLDLYLALVSDELSSQAYPAAIAGLGFGLSRWENGINLSIQGYSEKQPVLLATVLDTLSSPDWDQGRYQRVKMALQRNWRNSVKDWPVRQVLARISPVLQDHWLAIEKAETLETISLSDVKIFADSLFGQGRNRYFASGNLPAENATSMAMQIKTRLSAQGFNAEVNKPLYTVKNLVEATSLPVFRTFIDHNDSAAVLFLQGREDTLEERALFALLQIATKAPFYSELRTEKQLGYVVGSRISPMHRVPGLIFYVQSPVVSSDKLQIEINRFFEDFASDVVAFSESDLERFKQSVLANIEEKPKNIHELSARYLQSLRLDYDNFDFREQLAASIRATSLVDFKGSYQRVFAGSREGFWVLSTANLDDATESRITNDRLVEGIFNYPQ